MSSFTCPHCGQKLLAPEGRAGGNVICRRCCQVLTVPPPAPTPQRPSDHSEAATVAPRWSSGGPGADDAAGHEQATVPPSGARSDTHGGAGPKGGGRPDALTDFLAPPQGPDEIGRLGPYRVLKVLGAGGMGVVYLAEDPKLRRRVALKAILPSVAAGPTARERFLREARAAAAVEHDHIVAVHQVDEDRGVPYLVMPLLRGEPLEARLRREKRLPLADVLRIARQTAEGLEAARRGGLVHRDIKPANLWLEEGTGRVKILDFGLARSHDDDRKRLTQLGALIGTPAYMAPEQAAGQGDHRADLFSLGCVMYRMATGEPAFQEADMISTIAAVAADPVRPPREVNPALPPALSDLILRLLAKKPEERPASAQAVVEAIRAIQAALKAKAAPLPAAPAPVVARAPRVVEAAPPVRRGRAGLWLVLAASVLVGGLAVGGYFLWKQATAPAVVAAPPAPPNTVPDGPGQPNQPGSQGDPSGNVSVSDPVAFHLTATIYSMREGKEEGRSLKGVADGVKEKLLGAMDDAISQLKLCYKDIYGKDPPYVKPDPDSVDDKDNKNLRRALREVKAAKDQLRAAKGVSGDHRDAALAAMDAAAERLKDALDRAAVTVKHEPPPPPPPILDDLLKDKDPKSLPLPDLTGWAMLPDGVTLIVGLADGTLVYIDTVAAKELKRVKAPVRPDILAAQGKRLFVALKGGKVVRVLDRDSGEDLKKEISLPDGDLTALFSGPEPGPVYAALPKGLAVVDADAGAAKYMELQGQPPPIPGMKTLPNGVAFDPIGKMPPTALAFDPNHADTLYAVYMAGGNAALAKFTIKGDGLTWVGFNYTAGRLVNGALPDSVSVGVSHDGKFVGVSASGSYRPPGEAPLPAGEAAVGVFTADDISAHAESVACGVVPRDLAFHPVLDLGVAEEAWLGPTGRHLHLFNSTSLVEVARFDIPHPTTNPGASMGARLLTFGGRGTRLIYYDGTHGVLHLIPLLSSDKVTLSDKDKEALAKACPGGGK